MTHNEVDSDFSSLGGTESAFAGLIWPGCEALAEDRGHIERVEGEQSCGDP